MAAVVPSSSDQETFREAVHLGKIDVVEQLIRERRVDASANENEALVIAARTNRPSRMISVLLQDERVVGRGIPFSAYYRLSMYNRAADLHLLLRHYASSYALLEFGRYGRSYEQLVATADENALNSLRVLIDDLPMVFGIAGAQAQAESIAQSLAYYRQTFEKIEVLLSNRLMFDALSDQQHAAIERQFGLSARRAALREGVQRMGGLGTQNGPLDIILSYISPGTRSVGALQPLPTSSTTLKRKRQD